MYLILQCYCYDEYYDSAILAQIEITDELIEKIKYRRKYLDITPIAEVDTPDVLAWYDHTPTLFEDGPNAFKPPEDLNIELWERVFKEDKEIVFSEEPLSREPSNMRIEMLMMYIDEFDTQWKFCVKNTPIRFRTGAIPHGCKELFNDG